MDMQNQIQQARKKCHDIIQLIQKEDVKKAVKAIKLSDAAVLNTPDLNGSYVMHYAAMKNFPDIIQALVDMQARVVIWDRTGQTPLHRAAKFGVVNTILALLAHGSVVYSVDWMLQSPIELAVAAHHVNVVELLLRCGSVPYLLNWGWARFPSLLGPDQKSILDLLSRYKQYVSGYKQGSIRMEVKHVHSIAKTEMKVVGVTVDMKSEKTDFYILVRRLQTEYTDIINFRGDEVHLLSDVIEFQTWNYPRKEISLKIVVIGKPTRTEDVVFIAEVGVIGTVVNTEINEEKQISTISVDVKIIKGRITKFALGSIPKKQMVTVKKEGDTIFPEMEPGSSIDIPPEAFNSSAKMSLSVIDNKEDEDEDQEIAGEDLLLSNTMCISMSNKSQPSKELKTTLPLYKTKEHEEYVVVSTSKENPQSLADWDILPVTITDSGKDATFGISHFSIYAITTKANKEKNLKGVTNEIKDKMHKKKKIKFLVFARPSNSAWPVVVAFPMSRKIKNCVKTWEKKGYDKIGEAAKEFSALEGQTFMFSFKDNVRLVEESQLSELCFESNRENVLNFMIQPCFPDREKKGIITVIEEKDVAYTQKVQKSGFLCFEGATEEVTYTEKVKEDLAEITITLPELPTETNEPMPIEEPTLPEPEPEPEPPKEPTPEPIQEPEPEPELPKEPTPEPIQEPEPEPEPPKEPTPEPIQEPEPEPPQEPKQPTEYETYEKKMKKAFEDEDFKDQSTIPVLTFRSIRALVRDFTTDEARSLGAQLGMNAEKVQGLIGGRPGFLGTKNVLVRFRGMRPHRSQVYTLIDALKACGMPERAEKVEKAYDKEVDYE